MRVINALNYKRHLYIFTAIVIDFLKYKVRPYYRFIILLIIVIQFNFLVKPYYLNTAWSFLIIYLCCLVFFETKLSVTIKKKKYIYLKLRIVIDFLCFSGFIFALKDINSDLYLLYLIPILGASKYFRVKGFIITFLSFILIHFSFFLFVYWLSENLTTTFELSMKAFLIRTVFFIIIGFYANREALRTLQQNKVEKIGRLINEKFFSTDLLENIVEEISYLFGIKDNCIFIDLVNHKSKRLIIVNGGGEYFDKKSIGLETPIGNGITGLVAQSGKPYICNNINKLPLFDEKNNDFINKKKPTYIRYSPKTCSEIAVPIKRGNTVLGVLNVESKRYGAFTNFDVGFLTKLSQQAAISIQSAAIFETYKSISTSLNLDEILDKILEQTNKLIPFENAIIFRFVKREKKLKPERMYRYDEEFMRKHDLTFSKDEQITGLLISDKETLLIENVPESDYNSKYPLIGQGKTLVSYLGVRLSIGEQIVGAFIINSDKENRFSEQDKDLLNLIGAQAAIAITKAKEYKALHLEKINNMRAHEKERDVVQKMITSVNEKIELQQTLDTILENCMGHTNGKSGFILVVNKDKKLIAKAQKNVTPKHNFEKLAEKCLVIKTGNSFISRNIEEEKEFEYHIYKKYLKDTVRSFIAVPMKLPKDIKGVISIQSREKDKFTQEQKKVLEIFAAHASISLDKTITFSQLSKLHKIQPLLNEKLNMAKIVKKINAEFNSTGCSLFLKEGNELVCVATTRDIDIEKKRIVYGIEEKEHLTSYIGRTNEPVRLYNASDAEERCKIDPALKERKGPKFMELDTENPRSFLGVPLKSEKKNIGVIRLIRDKDLSFTLHDQQILELVSDNLASKIKNEKLLIETKETRLLLIQNEKMVALGLMAGGIAHQINNPLGILKAYCTNLLDIVKDKTTTEMIKGMKEEVDRTGKTVKNLLEFSRPSRGEDILTDVNVQIDKALDLVNHELKLRNIKVKKSFSLDLPQILADPNELSQVFLNLITNAYQSMQDRGKLIIRTNKNISKNNIIIEFIDTGHGISEEERNKIFDPFFTKRQNGTGLGLSICLKIIKKHGGTIEVKSKEREGTHFFITLPIKEVL